jgi:hypothetical protein
MTPKRRIQKLAALVDAAPNVVAEVVADVLHETVNELRTYKPGTCRRVVQGIRKHQKNSSVTRKDA